MKKSSILSLLIWNSLCCLSQDITGSWKGLLNAGSQKLTLVFHVKKDSSNYFRSSFDSPDQGAHGIPCSETSLHGDSLEILIQAIQGGYRGKWDGRNNISGYFFQVGQHFGLDLTRTQDTVVSLARPQTPKPPFPYRSEELEYDNQGIHYSGTLTYPNSGGPFPAAILITGSGQQDRDETIFGHKPFAVIADYLTRRGFAVLRVDDRQTGKSTGDVSRATTLDFSKDVETSLLELKKRKDIDGKKIGLIGHSEGGMIAAMVASENPTIQFIILLAGPGQKGLDLVASQIEAYDLSLGATAEIAKADQELKFGMMKALLSSTDTATRFDNAWQYYLNWKKKTNPEIVEAIHINTKANAEIFIRSYIKGMDRPWTMYFLQSDPAVYLVSLKCKVLALNGARDIQVVPDPNLTAIDSALKKSRVKLYHTEKIPGLNHLFQHCKTCTVKEYGELEETFSPGALQIMGDWLDKNAK